MAHSMTEEELIAALEAKGTYVVKKKSADLGDTPVTPPGDPPTHNPLTSPPPSARTPKVRISKPAPLKMGEIPRTLKLEDYLAARPKELATSTPITRNPDTSHDITHYRLATPSVPKVPFFSGDDQKGDVSYIEWRFEIRCLLNDADISTSILVQAIRKSLRGTARSVLVSLGENASADAILSKLDSLFGDVSTNGMLMQEFFNSFQKQDESVTSFGCRLERLLQLAVDHGHLARDAKNDLLRHKFWTSLASDKLKSQTRHKYDSIANYDDLLREIRTVEKEMSMAPSVTSGPKKQAVHQPLLAEDQIKEVEKRMDKKLESLEKKLDSKLDEKFNLILKKLDQRPLADNRPYNNRDFGTHKRPNNNSTNNNNSGNRRSQQGYGRGRGKPPVNRNENPLNG